MKAKNRPPNRYSDITLSLPDVFNGGQPTGGSPNPNGVDKRAASP
jgi:hypothetical protein